MLSDQRKQWADQSRVHRVYVVDPSMDSPQPVSVDTSRVIHFVIIVGLLTSPVGLVYVALVAAKILHFLLVPLVLTAHVLPTRLSVQ